MRKVNTATIELVKSWTKRTIQLSGKKNPFYGKMHTDEVKAKLKAKKYSPIICINLITNESTIVSGTRNANTLTLVARSIITKILNNSKESYKNWTFKRGTK